MSIISFQFLIFALLTIVIYFLAPKKLQWFVLLGANVYFYTQAKAFYLVFIVASTVFTYLGALSLEKVSASGTKKVSVVQTKEDKKNVREKIVAFKKRICFMTIVLVMGSWIVLKYGNFFMNNVGIVLNRLHVSYQKDPITLLLPIGISFYTFHAVGYLVDIYRGKYTAEKNVLKLFTFLSYFPHIIQGPFSRFDHTGMSILQGHTFSYDRFCRGCSRILWGFFKKLLVADKIGIAVNSIFDNYLEYSGVHLLFAMIGYCIQLYADFSGYMDIVSGVSTILGIELAENFKQPFFAKSIDEFWRRWHISLGKWFKDYVFYPVSMGATAQKIGKWSRKRLGNKVGKLAPGYFALIFVWTATGLWHGANWTFLVWGYLNLFVIILSMQLGDAYHWCKEKLKIQQSSKVWGLFCIVRTFLLVCFFRFFSVPDTLNDSISMLKHVALQFHPQALVHPLTLFAKMHKRDILICLFGMMCMLIVDILNEKEKWENIKTKTPMLIRNGVYAMLIVAIIMFAGANKDIVGGFIYANF